MSDPIRWADTDFAVFTAAAVAMTNAIQAVDRAESLLADRDDPVVLPAAALRDAADDVRAKLAPLMYAAADAAVADPAPADRGGASFRTPRKVIR